MNPLLDDAQREHIAAARGAVEENLAQVADGIDAEGSCPAEVLETLATAALLGGSEADRLLRLSLTVEQVGRKSAAVAALVACRGIVASLVGAEQAGGIALITDGVGARPSGDGYVLDGEARLVVAAANAADFLVATAAAGETAIWRVPAGTAGVQVEAAEELLGLNGAGVATVRFAAARVGADARIADGAASTAARDWLTTTLAAVAVGVARGALDAAVGDVITRRDAGDRADRSQAVQWMLADIATEAEAARVATWYAATQPPGAAQGEAAAMCRVLASEAAVGATRRAVQVMGDRGLLRSSGIERLYRDAKVLEILGGSNEANLARIASFRLPDLARA